MHALCPEKGEAKKSTRLLRENKRKAVISMKKTYPLLKMRKKAMELLLKILLHNVQSPTVTAITWIQNALLLFVIHILSNWQGVKFKSSGLSTFLYGFILC